MGTSVSVRRATSTVSTRSTPSMASSEMAFRGNLLAAPQTLVGGHQNLAAGVQDPVP